MSYLNPTAAPAHSHPAPSTTLKRLGLGQAPYKLLGIQKRTYQSHYGAAVQPGGCCMFCATGIVYLFWLLSADGKKFYVGSDCILKSGDAGLALIIDPHVKKHEKEIREERENHYISEFKKFVETTNYFASPAMLAGVHPNRYYASLGKTLGDLPEVLLRQRRTHRQGSHGTENHD